MIIKNTPWNTGKTRLFSIAFIITMNVLCALTWIFFGGLAEGEISVLLEDELFIVLTPLCVFPPCKKFTKVKLFV